NCPSRSASNDTVNRTSSDTSSLLAFASLALRTLPYRGRRAQRTTSPFDSSAFWDHAMFDVSAVRRQFPALQRQINGTTPVFLDGPGGTQVPQAVIDAMVNYLTTCNANHGGLFVTSRQSDAILHDAHQALADFVNADSPDEIV